MSDIPAAQFMEMTVTNKEGKMRGLEGSYGSVSVDNKPDPYRFYASEIPDDPAQEAQEIIMVLPLGGELSGLYRFPRIGEKILAAAGQQGGIIAYYMMGYVPTKENPFHTKGEKEIFEEKGEVFRYRQTGKALLPEEEAFSEIGFYQRPTAWKAADAEEKDYGELDGAYPRIDRINIHSTGDIHESAVNHLRTSAKRLELLADCEGAAGPAASRPLGDAGGDDSGLYAGDVHVRAKNRIVIKAAEEIRLQVGRSAVIITDDGITITSKKTQKDQILPWDTVINLTPRDGITLSGQNVNIGAAYNFSIRESTGGAISSLGGVMRLSARDLLAQSYCQAGYKANTADFIKAYTATAKGMAGGGDLPSYTSLRPSLAQIFANGNWGYSASTSNYADPPGDYAAYCGLLLQLLSLTYTGLDLDMSEEERQNGGRDAFNAAVLADQQEKVQEMLKYIDDAGDPERAIHNGFLHLTCSADAVLSGYDNKRLSVNIIDDGVPTAGTNDALTAREAQRPQEPNFAETILREILKTQENYRKANALWALGTDPGVLNKRKEL